jgi:hypothetical protein
VSSVKVLAPTNNWTLPLTTIAKEHISCGWI